MTVIFSDGFDDMGKPGDVAFDMSKVFSSFTLGGQDTTGISPGQGRFGGNAVFLGLADAGNAAITPDPLLVHNTLTGVTSLAFRSERHDTSGTILIVEDINDNPLFSVGRLSSGALDVRDSQGVLLGTSGIVTSIETWHFMEVRWSVTAGEIILRLDQNQSGASDLFNFSGVDLGSIAMGKIRYVGVAGDDSKIDDIIVLTLAGTRNNDFLGDGRIVHLRPNADISPNQWVPSVAGLHHLMVDDIENTDAEATDLSTNSAELTERFGFTDLPAGLERVDFVLQNLRANDDTGGLDLVNQIVSSGVTVEQTFNLLTTVRFLKHIREDDPATGQRWLRAAVNAVQGGFKST